MEYIYSAMILHKAGKKITEENVTKILKAAGIKPDTARIKALTTSLEDIDIEEAISTPTPTTTIPTTPTPASTVEEPKEKKEEEKKKKEKKEEEVSEEEAAAGLSALFG